MGKNKKRKRDKSNIGAAGAGAGANATPVDLKGVREERAGTAKAISGASKKGAVVADSPPPHEGNPLLHEQQTFLQSLSETEFSAFFDDEAVDPTRRAEIWMQQADLGEDLINRYAWATPDERSLRILAHFSPLIEIGCGSNAYWCRQMIQTKTLGGATMDVVGYDTSPSTGGTIGKSTPEVNQDGFRVRQGGPDVLSDPRHAKRTLFLCYPDENDTVDDETGAPTSMAAACLEHYQGDYIIHVGELVTSPSLSLDQAPWGRSSSPDFQERLLGEYHCILSVRLSNWLHTADTLTVWKRSSTTTIVFAAEDDDDDAEECEFRHIPMEERLPVDLAAPCLQHLLNDSMVVSNHGSSKNDKKVVSVESKKSDSLKSKKAKKVAAVMSKSEPEQDDPSAYECPW